MILNVYMSPAIAAAVGVWLVALLLKSLKEFLW